MEGGARRPRASPPGRALARTVVVKLNGGLGTSMGMTKAKSLLPAKDGLSSLDIIIRGADLLRTLVGLRFAACAAVVAVPSRAISRALPLLLLVVWLGTRFAPRPLIVGRYPIKAA